MLDRFWAKVDFNGPLWNGTPCWVWAASLDREGYGLFWFGRNVLAHRFAYVAVKGPIPEELEVDHLCRNRACENPQHMEPVTRQVNVLRGISFSAVNAVKTQCLRGHLFDERNTRIGTLGSRFCRECQREYRRSYQRRRAKAPV